MEWILVLLLFSFLAYLVWDEVKDNVSSTTSRHRLCDYEAGGSVFEPVSDALGRGIRVIEIHVYSDEQGHPVVATRPAKDIAEDNVSFESVCVAILNDAFPSTDPLILSIVPHTEQAITFDRMVEHLETTLRRHLVKDKDITTRPLDDFVGKVVIVSGGYASGTSFSEYVNLNWNESNCRRLDHHQATHPRDPDELLQFNQDYITIVSPDPKVKTKFDNPLAPARYGCQWNFFSSQPGFVKQRFR